MGFLGYEKDWGEDMNKHGGYFGEDKKEIIDFSVNINPLGVPETLMTKLKEGLPSLISYPEIDGYTAKMILSKHLKKDMDEIILGNGATELIYLFARAMKAKKAVIIQPTFTEYKRAFRVSGTEIINFYTHEKDGFRLDMASLLQKIEMKMPEVVVLCNPNNPTGVFYEPLELTPLLEKLKSSGSYLFIDESFIDFTKKKSLEHLINEYPIFILRSMTKTYAIPGLRLGYGLSSREMIKKLKEVKEPWTINSLALIAVEVLLDDIKYQERTQEWYSTEKQFLRDELSSIDALKVFPSEGNFFLCRLHENIGVEAKKNLLERGIYIRTCEDFEGLSDEYIRLAIRSREENIELIKALKSTL